MLFIQVFVGEMVTAFLYIVFSSKKCIIILILENKETFLFMNLIFSGKFD